MADEADIGTEASESEREYQMSEIRRLAEKKEVEATGACLSCGDKVKNKNIRWCSPDCRDDWEFFKRKNANSAYA